MALLLIFTENLDLINYENRKLYLDQKFYSFLFKNHQSFSKGSQLRKVALMTYGDDTIIKEKELLNFKEEVDIFFDQKPFEHDQVSGFIEVIESAISEKQNLIISGDMYPEHNKNRALT